MAPRRPRGPRAPSAEEPPDLPPGFLRRLVDTLHQRFDPIAEDPIPEQITRLIHRLKEVEEVAAGNQARPPGREPREEPRRSVVNCPYCLGTGQRAGANAAQTVCPECKGRGLLDRGPNPPGL
jgi:hypothetical protein